MLLSEILPSAKSASQGYLGGSTQNRPDVVQLTHERFYGRTLN